MLAYIVSFTVVGIAERCHIALLFVITIKMSYRTSHVSWISNWMPLPRSYEIAIHHLSPPSAVCLRNCLDVHFSDRQLFSSVSITEQEVRFMTRIIRRKGRLHTINYHRNKPRFFNDVSPPCTSLGLIRTFSAHMISVIGRILACNGIGRFQIFEIACSSHLKGTINSVCWHCSHIYIFKPLFRGNHACNMVQ